MKESNKAVIEALKNGDKPWKHIGTIQMSTKLDEQVVRDALADLLQSDTVDLGVDPSVRKPIFALKERLLANA